MSLITSTKIFFKKEFVTIIAFLFSVIGLIMNVFPSILGGTIPIYLPDAELYAPIVDNLLAAPFDIRGKYYFMNIFLFVLMLIGTFIYIFTKKKETRLLRFCFAILFYSYVFVSFLIIFNLFNIYVLNNGFAVLSHGLAVPKYYFVFVLLNLIFKLLYGYISYYCLKVINNSKQLCSDATEDLIHDTEVSRTTRFFHYIVDTIFSFVLFFPFFKYIIADFIFKFLPNDERFILFVILVMARFSYYLFFEAIFNATPAKFFTETRVVSEYKDEKLNFSKVFVRTLCRFVPFEPFSFFFSYGWHDTWSETTLVKEKQTGFSIKYYWFLFLAIIGIYAGSVYYVEWKQKHDSYVYQKTVYEDNTKKMNMLINKKIESKPIILKLNEKDDYSSTIWYLVSESKSDSGIVFSAFQANSYSKLYELEQRYSSLGDSLLKVTIPKSKLLQAIVNNYDDYDNNKFDGVELIPNQPPMIIENAKNLYAPDLSSGGSSMRLTEGIGEISIGISNEGYGGVITKITNVKGNIMWMNTLPFTIEYPSSSFYIYGSKYDGGEYEFTFDVVCRDQETIKYQIKGKGMDFMLNEIE